MFFFIVAFIFRLIESDLLLTAAVKWGSFDWETVPRSSSAHPLLKYTYDIVKRLDNCLMGAPFSKLLRKGTSGLVSFTEAFVFKAMQYIIDMQLKVLLALMMLVFLPDDLCWSHLFGKECPYDAMCSLGVFDTIMRYVIAGLWFLLLMFPAVFFFMPMLFGTRVDKDWRRSRLLRATYAQVHSDDMVEARKCGGGCDDYIDQGQDGVFKYTSRLPDPFWGLRLDIFMKHCWGDDIEWLGSWLCLPKAMLYGAGMLRDVFGTILRSIIGTVHKALCDKKSACGFHKYECGGGCCGCIKCFCWKGCYFTCLPWVILGAATQSLYSLLAVFKFYVRVILTAARNNLRRLILMTTSVYTEEVLEKHEILERTSANTLQDSRKSHHEQVTFLSAKLHGLFWLFVPGASVLSKMAEYLNEDPWIYLLGDQYREVKRLSEMPKVDFKVRFVRNIDEGNKWITEVRGFEPPGKRSCVLLHMRGAQWPPEEFDASKAGLEVDDTLIIIKSFSRTSPSDPKMTEVYPVKTMLTKREIDDMSAEKEVVSISGPKSTDTTTQSSAVQTVSVQVPQGMQGGMPMQVQTPGGVMQVQIPAGLQPGMAFQIQVPAAPQPVDMSQVQVQLGPPREQVMERGLPVAMPLPQGMVVGSNLPVAMEKNLPVAMPLPQGMVVNSNLPMAMSIVGSPPPSPPPSPPEPPTDESQGAVQRVSDAAVDVVVRTKPAHSVRISGAGGEKNTAPGVLMTVRLYNDKHTSKTGNQSVSMLSETQLAAVKQPVSMRVINKRWLYRDSRSRSERCGVNPGMIMQKVPTR